MTEKRKPKSYSKAFKEETVALVTEQGYSVAEPRKRWAFVVINCTAGSKSRKR